MQKVAHKGQGSKFKNETTVSQTSESERKNESCDSGSTDTTKTTKVIEKTHALSRLFWVAAIIFAIVVVLKLTGLGNNPSKRITIPPPESVEAQPTTEEVEALQKQRQHELERQRLNLEKEKLLADVKLRVQKYRGDIAAMVEKWRKMLPLSEAEEYFRKSEAGASFISSREGLCGFKCCVSLAYKMAYDKLKGTTRAEDAVFPIVKEKVVDDIERAVNVYSKWTEDFHKQLVAENMALAADLAVRSQSFESSIVVFTDESAKDIGNALDAFVRDIRDHASQAAFSTVELAAEMVMIKSSYSAIKKGVVSLAGMALSGAVTRASASAAAGGTAAAADGPLPIGDVVGGVITVAGLSWTAYDIYKVTQKMPTEMKDKIQESISQTRDDLDQSARKNLKGSQEQCNLYADQILSEVSSIMKEE